MGVLNVTPDSFSDGGKHDAVDSALAHARRLSAQGATIIDVGGESTRPGATPVDGGEERRRVLPVIEALAAEGIIVSVDTIHADTARRAVAAGARIINDVSGGTHDPHMLRTAADCAAQHGTDVILGHWRGFPDATHRNSHYDDVVGDVRDWLAAQRDAALTAGIDAERIVLDPGLGFDKTGDQCWELLANLASLTSLGHRVLIGASRKRMLAELLNTLPDAARDTGPDGRDLATAVTSAFAVRGGAWGVRVHDVAASVQALAVEGALHRALRSGQPESDEGRPTGARSREQTARGAVTQDRITLTGLEVFAHHGVFDFERETGQPFVIDAELTVDLSAAARGDALDRTVHYGDLATALTRAVQTEPVDLIETVAERVAKVALDFGGVETVRITVHKPHAPIDASFADVSVTVVRHRGVARHEGAA